MKRFTIIKQRTLEEARFFIDNQSTVRATAKALNISKSTVHKDLTQRLSSFSPILYDKVLEIISKNTDERAMRGGQATKKMYENLKK